MYTHLTMEEREVISQRHFAGESNRAIARRIGRSASTIGRELARNAAADGTYSAWGAQQQSTARRRERPRIRKMDEAVTNTYVRMRLTQRWSPDQIAGRLKREHPQDRRRQISHQTIYDWIKHDDDRAHWQSLLRRGGRRRPAQDRRGKLPASVSIADRPRIVDTRRRFGDWEGDTIVGKRHCGGLVTLNERKSGFLITRKVKDRTARRVRRAITQRLSELPSSLCRTLTLDNGKEFSEHEALADRLDLGIYFAEPYKSWQRGSNENTNGLLRQFFPKGTDFRHIGWQTIAEATDLINNRPRKRLNYQTPNEVLASHLGVAIEI
jgi:transposase, IS30 family